MHQMPRRRFLLLGAAVGGTVVLGGAGRFGGSTTSAAQRAVPTVDRLVLTNVVDYVTDTFVPGGQIGNITVQRNQAPLGSTTGLLQSEWGLAYHLESVRGDERKEILLDFARTELTLTNNYAALGVDPGRADALILSHGHGDHWGGLPNLAASVPAWGVRRSPLYAGGEDTFCHRWTVNPAGQRRDQGQLSRAELESWGLPVTLAKEGTVVAGHAITSGQIPRLTDFEEPLPAARLEVGAPGSSCEAEVHFPPGMLQVEAQPGQLVQDIFWGEHATAYNVRDRGLVVISSCGHAGIVNSVRQLQKVTGIERVHAIVGGWHLAPAADAVVQQTVEAFKDINPDYLIPMHCSGNNTMAAIQREMPTKLVRPSTGTRIVFGA
jgi:7,8-dihydropterin-6-yl-methyl-4-(beta-D-ribofuranosyl)aminobenzene 5'-phosphate synthase